MRTLRILPLFLALAALPAARAEEQKPYALGDKVELGKLDRVTGGDAVDLAAALEGSKRGLILVWYSPTCPWCFKFSKQYAALRKKYEAKGWTFVGIFSNSPSEQLPDAETHKRLYEEQGIEFPMLHDKDKAYMKRFGTARTPTFCVIDKKARLVYRGAPWNREDRTPYLAEFLDAIEKGEVPPARGDDTAAWG